MKAKHLLLSIVNEYFSTRYKNNLRVLAYHDVKEKNHFEKHLDYLSKHGFNIIDIDTLSEHIYSNRSLPSKPVLITFDDGDYSVLQNGIPILMKYKMPSVLFIITELIGSRRAFWWDRIRKNMYKKGISQKEIVKAIDFAKKSDNQKRIEFLSTFDELESRQLTESELVILQEGKMSICNHSHTHPMFDRCSAEEIENELTNTRAFFEKSGVGRFEFFAYPNGNNDEVSRSLLEKKGVKLAFLFDHQLNKKKIDALCISRIRMNSDTSMQEFKIRLSGTHSYFLNKRNQLSRFKSIFK